MFVASKMKLDMYSVIHNFIYKKQVPTERSLVDQTKKPKMSVDWNKAAVISGNLSD